MTAQRGRQLALDLPIRSSLSREDFLVAPSNSQAVALIDSWPQWPLRAAVIVGAAGSGKSHLVEVWRQKSHANRVSAQDLNIGDVPKLVSSHALAVEDFDSGDVNELALFHLINFSREHDDYLLFTAHRPPSLWPIRLADLASRLKSFPVVEMGLPDDVLLRGVIVKLFADRQISVDEATVTFLLMRMPRSLEAARQVVDAIDRTALEEKAEVTKRLISRVLVQFTEPELFSEPSDD